MINNQHGAVLLEYVIGLAALIVVFVAAATYLGQATEARANLSQETANTTLPCAAGLEGEECL